MKATHPLRWAALVAGLAGLLAALALGVACADDDDDGSRGYPPGDDDGGGTIDDDGGDDDDDTGDDDDDTAAGAEVLLIRGNDESAAAALAAEIEGFGYDVTLLSELEVDADTVAGYDLFVIAADTQWLNASRAQAVHDTGRPTFGIYSGGALFFEALDLTLGFSGGQFFDFEDSAHAEDEADAIWNQPNRVDVPGTGIVQLFSSIQFARAENPVDQTGIEVYATIVGSPDHIVLAVEDGRFFFWGFDTPTAALTPDGAKVLENALYLALRRG